MKTPTTKNPEAAAYELAIPADVRLRNGQFYTPASVCDWMLTLSKPANFYTEPRRILEPGCGPGSFLTRLALWLDSTSDESTGPSIELHGIELDASAAQLAQTLVPRAGKGYQSQIHTLNFISPEVDRLGLFDWIVGNPPYVRQEHLAQSEGVDKKAMSQLLQEKYADYLTRFPEQRTLFSQTADLYLWFYLQAATLLKPDGHLAFITSNSWLNTAYGQHFQAFLSHHFQILAMAESACERWFPDAAINPVILILQKKSGLDRPDLNDKTLTGQSHPVHLIRILKPLREVLPEPAQAHYWTQLAQKTEEVFHGTPTKETGPNTTSTRAFQTHQLTSKQLYSEPFKSNWAIPLRASSELIELLGQPVLWRKLEDLGQVRYPLKTGINAFFYLSTEKARQWRIEPEFLLPVLRSSRQVKHYVIQEKALQEFLFSCPYTKEELAGKGFHDALAYVEWGETQSAPPRQKRAQAVPWPKVASIQSNRPWHYTKPLPPAHLLCPRFIDQRFFFPLCEGKVMEDQTFYGLTIHQPEQHPPAFLAALLNSTLSYLLTEHSGRTNLGEGVLQYARGDMGTFSILNPDLYGEVERQQLIQAFHTLSQRPILPLAQELATPERLALVALVLAPVLLTAQRPESVEAFRETIARQLLNRVAERQKLAHSVRRKSTLK